MNFVDVCIISPRKLVSYFTFTCYSALVKHLHRNAQIILSSIRRVFCFFFFSLSPFFTVCLWFESLNVSTSNKTIEFQHSRKKNCLSVQIIFWLKVIGSIKLYVKKKFHQVKLKHETHTNKFIIRKINNIVDVIYC